MERRTTKTTSVTGSEGMQRRQAFTLIELSIAVFIMAMIVAVAMPQFVRSYNNQLLIETARTFATTCQLARVEAVTGQMPATLHINLERQMFWVTQPVKADDGTIGENRTAKVHQLDKRVMLVSAERADGVQDQPKQVDVTFYPNGTCDSVTVAFRNGERGGLVATLDPITCQAISYVVK